MRDQHRILCFVWQMLLGPTVAFGEVLRADDIVFGGIEFDFLFRFKRHAGDGRLGSGRVEEVEMQSAMSSETGVEIGEGPGGKAVTRDIR